MGGHTPVLVYGGLFLTLLQASFGTNNTTRWCSNTTSALNATDLEIDSISDSTLGINYYLYKANMSRLTWCDGYQICQDQGQSLAVLDTKTLQENISNFNISHVSQVWIAGRRKEDGSNWTWITEYLTDISENLTISGANNSSKECGRVTLINNESKAIYADLCDLPKPFICFLLHLADKVTTITLSWNKAMNYCVAKGGRLATLEEITVENDGNAYWFGLQRRPWLWVEPDDSVRPVLYSSWLSTSDGDCMALLPNGSWTARLCNDPLQYVLCQDQMQPTTEFSTVGPSGEPAKGNGRGKDLVPRDKIIIGVAVAVAVVVIVIIIVAVCCTKRNKPVKSTNIILEGIDNPSATANCEEVGPNQNEYLSECAAYKPAGATNTVSPYAEIELKPNSASEPVYYLSKGLTDSTSAKCTDPVIYSELKKPKSDETVLVENAVYGPAVNKKKPPPKPKRSAPL